MFNRKDKKIQPTGSSDNSKVQSTKQHTAPLPRTQRSADKQQSTGPLPQTNLEARSSRPADSKARSVLLVVLPFVALVLVGVLAYLIATMPTESRVQMEKATKDPQMQRATQPTQFSPQKSPEVDKLTPARPQSADKISKEDIAKLIKTGAGIPPGNQDRKELPQEPSTLVWKSPVEYVAPERAMPAANEEASETPSSEGVVDLSGEEPTADQITETPEEGEGELENPPTDDLSFYDLPTEPQEYDHLSGGFEVTNLNSWIYGDVVNVRAADSMEAEILTELNAGDQVWELETNGSWSHVLLADGSEGYIYSSLLSYNFVPREEEIYWPEEPVYETNEFEPYYGTLYSLFSGVNVRREPSTASEILDTMYYGDYCEAIGYSGGWFQIQWYDGEVAYVHGDFLTSEVITSEEISGEVVHEDVQYVATDLGYVDNPADLAGGQAVVNLAMQYVGYPYVYGANGPDAFDCSGFAQYIYSQMGVGIGRSTYDQIYDGIPVTFGYKDYSYMVPGDLVLFGEGTNVYHVGIYIGGGQMVHAGNSSTGVIIDSLNSDYYAPRIAAVRRIFY